MGKFNGGKFVILRTFRHSLCCLLAIYSLYQKTEVKRYGGKEVINIAGKYRFFG